ncbi:MAG: hypothetical protein JSV38_13820 [Desulfobacterales bacterium]|nr:MAG: hypothetical protein JSV38_13820 [Desulfobacterales bacterium]
MQLSRSAGIILVLVCGFFLQVLLAFADTRDTPIKAVVEFSKAYFKLDNSITERICKERLASEDVDVVDQYIYLAGKEAKDRGFDISFMKSKLYHIETEIITQTAAEAQIRITGKRRVAINPVYPIVTQVFDIGGTYDVDETIRVIKEDGKWKVCGDLFSLPNAS